jgi:hypothetical protein
MQFRLLADDGSLHVLPDGTESNNAAQYVPKVLNVYGLIGNCLRQGQR